MSQRIKGVTIVMDGDTKPLQAAMKDVNTTSSKLTSELNDINRLLKLDPSNTELLAQKQKALSGAVDNSTEKLKRLKDAEEEVERQAKNGDIGEDKYRAFKRELIAVENELDKNKTSLKSFSTQSKNTGDNLKNGLNKGINATAIGITAITAAASAAVIGLASLANSVLENVDRIAMLGDQYDLSAESIQSLEYVGTKLDVKLETMTKSMGKMVKVMDKARDVEARNVSLFKSLGVVITDGAGNLRNYNDVYEDTVDVLGKVKNPIERNALSIELLGVSFDDLGEKVKKSGMDGIMAKLAKSMDKANATQKKSVTSFNELGIEITDTSGNFRDQYVVWEETIGALGKIKNNAERNAIALRLFGKSALELNPIIKAGSEEIKRLADEARNTGAVVSNELMSDIDEFGDSMAAMKLSVQGMTATILSELMPSIKAAMSVLQDFVKNNKDQIVSFLKNSTSAIMGFVKGVWELRGVIAAIIPIMIGFKTILGISTLMNILRTAIESMAGATKIAAVVQGVYNAVLAACPAMIAVTAILALAGAIIGYNVVSKIGAENTTILNEKIKETEDAYNSANKAADQSRISGLAEANMAKDLAGELDKLNEKTKLTTLEKTRLKSIVEKLNNIMPDLSLKIDKETGKLDGNTSSIYKNIKALDAKLKYEYNYAKAQAAKNKQLANEDIINNEESLINRAKLTKAEREKFDYIRKVIGYEYLNEQDKKMGDSISAKLDKAKIRWDDYSKELVTYSQAINAKTVAEKEYGKILDQIKGKKKIDQDVTKESIKQESRLSATIKEQTMALKNRSKTIKESLSSNNYNFKGIMPYMSGANKPQLAASGGNKTYVTVNTKEMSRQQTDYLVDAIDRRLGGGK